MLLFRINIQPRNDEYACVYTYVNAINHYVFIFYSGWNGRERKKNPGHDNVPSQVYSPWNDEIYVLINIFMF